MKPNFSNELEQTILGTCLIESTAIGRTYGLIEPKSFYADQNRQTYEVMRKMYDQNIPIDHMTVWAELLKIESILPDVELAHYLTTLSKSVTSSTHLEYHCHILKELWKLRELEKLTSSGIDKNENTSKQITELTEQLNEIRGSEFKTDWYDMSELMVDLVKHQTEISQGKKNFISSGLKSLDKINGGFTGGEMIVIGARPSVGKTALMGLMAVSMAREGKKVGIISLEMSNTQIAGRIASLETGIDFQTIYRNLFEDEKQQQRFFNLISNSTANLPIYISDKTKVDINDIKAKCAKLKNKVNCDIVMIDYLQLVESSYSNKNYNREQEVAKISRGLKLMAIEMDIPVIVLCQLSRAVTSRSAKERYPKLSDLRESGSIEQDADIVMMLHSDWKSGYETDEQGGSTEFEADLLGLKWRNGSPFHMKLDFDPPKMKFSERRQMSFRPVNLKDEPEEETPF
jgi:replicative DNA helicase